MLQDGLRSFCTMFQAPGGEGQSGEPQATGNSTRSLSRFQSESLCSAMFISMILPKMASVTFAGVRPGLTMAVRSGLISAASTSLRSWAMSVLRPSSAGMITGLPEVGST